MTIFAVRLLLLAIEANLSPFRLGLDDKIKMVLKSKEKNSVNGQIAVGTKRVYYFFQHRESSLGHLDLED